MYDKKEMEHAIQDLSRHADSKVTKHVELAKQSHEKGDHHEAAKHMNNAYRATRKSKIVRPAQIVRKIQPELKESSDELKIGDRVHLGFGSKGGAGYTGTIVKLDHRTVEIELPPSALTRWGPQIVKGLRKFVTQESLKESTPPYPTSRREDIIKDALKTAQMKQKKKMKLKSGDTFEKEPVTHPLVVSQM